MSTSEVAVCLPPELEDRLVGDLERHGYRVMLRAASASELASAIGSLSVEFAVASADPDTLTAGLLAACDSAGVRLVGIAAGAPDRRNALELGLLEVVDATAGWDGLESALAAGIRSGTRERQKTTAGPQGNGVRADAVADAGGREPGERKAGTEPGGGEEPGEDSRRGEVIAVWGPAGSPGRTTLAIAIAAELAEEGLSVALADADTHSGSIAPVLGLLDEAPGFAAACRLAGTNSLTTQELERVAERYRSPHGSFWVLTGLGRPHRWPELSADRVVATIGACRDWVDVTVLDTGFSLENDEEISSDLFAPRRNAATISTLREADRIVAVGSGDPVGLSRFLRAHVDLLEIVDAERVMTVVNKVRGSAIGLNPGDQVVQTLRRFGGITSPALIPHDQQGLDAAVLSGKTLRDVAPKSAARLAVRRFVTSRLFPQPAPLRPAPKWRSRFEPVRD